VAEAKIKKGGALAYESFRVHISTTLLLAEKSNHPLGNHFLSRM